MAGRGSVFVIKPYRSTQRHEGEEKAIWKFLEKSVNQIYEKDNSDLSFEELYRFVFNLSHA